MSRSKRAKRLKPTGHSAVIESMIQPAIVIGSTLMSAIAAYVLALDEITRILRRTATPTDYFVVALCIGMGILIDMAIIVSATRYKMHAVRADPRERRWLTLAKWVLITGLASETMTLFFFFVHLDPQAFPDWLVTVASWIHSVLAVVRAFLPPVVIAYFAAGVLPVMFDRADRNREIKSRTSMNIMLLIDRLSEVHDTDDKTEMLQALGGQLMLDTYATYDETGRTTEDGQLHRDAKLLTHLARIHKLDWSTIAEDVAPELRVEPVLLPALPAPIRAPKTTPLAHTLSRPPTGPGSPATAHPPHRAPSQADSALAGVIDETSQEDEEEQNSRVLHIGRSRAAKRANARVRREAVHARRDVIRDAVYAVLDQAQLDGEEVSAISIRELVRRVNASGHLADGVKTSAKTVKRHLVSWQRDQSHQQMAVR